jgi:hypothetical protein
MGNCLDNCKYLYEVAWKLKGPLTREWAVKISWKSRRLTFRERSIDWYHFQPNLSRWTVPLKQNIFNFLALSWTSVLDICGFLCLCNYLPHANRQGGLSSPQRAKGEVQPPQTAAGPRLKFKWLITEALESKWPIIECPKKYCRRTDIHWSWS